ncbi:MAG: 50S ribosomal protein L31 [Chloroflexota bacterium]|nr:50S ribosomal protein L31 [Chloroflexota bacterium]
MKTGIHPNNVVATVQCACGHTWQTMSTKPVLKTDLCSNCHPFYTGEQRIVDTAGQVERFMRRMNNRSADQQTVKANRVTSSRNRANIPPPPGERRPAPRPEAEGEPVMSAAAEGEATEA